MLNNSGIYIIINLRDKKKYLGSTINLKTRKRNHFAYLKKGKHENKYLQRAFNKYGSDCFEFQIIELCEKEECRSLEQKYLNEIFSSKQNRKQYYNTNPNASCPPTMKGKDNPNYGKDFSTETRLKMSLAKQGNTGDKNNFFGKQHSEETKLKMKEAHNVSPIYAKNIITQEEKIFSNSREAAKYLGVNFTLICRRLNPNSKRYTNKLIKNEWMVSR